MHLGCALIWEVRHTRGLLENGLWVGNLIKVPDLHVVEFSDILLEPLDSV